MLFSSPLFLFLFLPVLLALYAITGRGLRNAAPRGEPALLHLGGGHLCLRHDRHHRINYGLGRWLEALPRGPSRPGWSSRWPSPSIWVCLIVFKYSNFLVDQLNVVLAAFQVRPCVSTTCTSRWGSRSSRSTRCPTSSTSPAGTSRAAKALDFATYMTFFPHSIAGPIVRYRRHRRPVDRAGRHGRGLRRGRAAVHPRAGQEDARGQHASRSPPTRSSPSRRAS